MDKPEITPPKLPDEKRRSIVRGGLAAPIVLGTLVSKQALGGGSSNYGCTVSGKWSGGSAHGTTPNCKTGKSCVEVQAACDVNNGGTPYIKGKCSKNYGDKVYWDQNNYTKPSDCGSKMSVVFPSGKCYRKYKTDSRTSGHWEMCGEGTPGRVEMTCYEALFLDKSCGDPKGGQHADLCREAVCAYYNAQNFQPQGYPCNTDQVRGLVNDCLQNDKVYLSKYFDVSDTSAYWTTQQCIDFFKGCRNNDQYT